MTAYTDLTRTYDSTTINTYRDMAYGYAWGQSDATDSGGDLVSEFAGYARERAVLYERGEAFSRPNIADLFAEWRESLG